MTLDDREERKPNIENYVYRILKKKEHGGDYVERRRLA